MAALLASEGTSTNSVIIMTGMHGRYAASTALDRSDLIIAVGTRFSDRATGNKAEFSKNHKVLHIDIDPAEISKNIPAYVALVADVKQALMALNAMFPARTWFCT